MPQAVQKAQFEQFDASAYRVGVVTAQFNRDITEGILQSALEKLAEYRVVRENVNIFRVAGSVEVPLILKKLAETGEYGCLIAIGAVIKGESAHFEYVNKIISEGVLQVQLECGVPVGFGVLTTFDKPQAEARLHVGAEAAEAALQNAKIIKEISDEDK